MHLSDLWYIAGQVLFHLLLSKCSTKFICFIWTDEWILTVWPSFATVKVLYKVYPLYMNESLVCNHQITAIGHYREYPPPGVWTSNIRLNTTVAVQHIWKNSEMNKYSSRIVFQKRETGLIRIGQSISFHFNATDVKFIYIAVFGLNFRACLWWWRNATHFPRILRLCEEVQVGMTNMSQLSTACTWKNVWERSD